MDNYDNIVKQYIVKRRNPKISTSNWEVVQVIESDMTIEEEVLSVEDVLANVSPQQYEYRVDVEVADKENYIAEDGKTVLASNVMICIDPGHYDGKNAVEGEESYGYAEGDFTLEIALKLKEILKEEYGIDACMTRETGSITINGYTDANLDKGHISLRGEYTAKEDCDLFVSIHTNANEENANQYPTCMQPIGINKPIILVNTTGCVSETVIKVSNAIGTNLAKVSYEWGIATVDSFTTVERGKVTEWTKEKNDMLDVPGTVYCRLGEDGDYYGVLKGAANVNKPGIIIEHGFHTVAEMRKEAMEGELKKAWAKADAYGIAYGFGFVSEIEMPKGDIR